MSESLLIWMFAGTWGVFGAWQVYLTKSNYALSTDITEIRFALIAISKNAARILHRDDDLYGLDKLVDKYDSTEDLSDLEWKELFEKSGRILNDENIARDDRNAANLLHNLARLSHRLARHKMNRYGI